MRILHVINSLTSGGAEKLVTDLSSEQAKLEENSVSLYTFYNNKDLFKPRLSKRVNYVNSGNNSFYSFKAIFLLYREIKKHDIVHVHLFPSFYIVAILSVFFRTKKFILTEHNSFNRRRNNNFFRLLEKIIYKKFFIVVCISKGVENSLKNWIKLDNTIIIPNFVNLNKIYKTPALHVRDSLSNDIKLVMVGSFTKQKDQITIIKAINKLPVNYKLFLIGDGPEKKRIENKIIELNLKERVFLLGTKSNVIEIIKNCNYGILSSNWEGFGIVALEYMASGLITLGTNVNGLNEVIPIKENLFETKDFMGLADRILAVSGSAALVNHILKIQNEALIKYDILNAVEVHQALYSNKLDKC